VQKLLAAAGVASRRAAEEWIRAGRVSVDGLVAKLGDSADPARQTITVDGRALELERPAYWIVHKPRSVLTTTSDPHGRPTVLGLLPPDVPRLYPVGRLDWETEGLVLLTNDGDVAHALLHPSLGSEREYRVTVRGAIPDAVLRRLARGVDLDDGATAPARVGPARFDRGTDTSSFSLVLFEGRKRQIRRAMQALGHPVRRLVRVRMGPIELGTLAPGRARALRPAEIAMLREQAVGAAGRQAGGKREGQVPEARKKARATSRKAPRRS
jgi:23S rRNA pseudouridine2605 synthase